MVNNLIILKIKIQTKNFHNFIGQQIVMNIHIHLQLLKFHNISQIISSMKLEKVIINSIMMKKL
jgi:hypothetical protein